MHEMTLIDRILQAYTFSIFRYYAEHDGNLPSNRELRKMQREAIEHPPETWEWTKDDPDS